MKANAIKAAPPAIPSFIIITLKALFAQLYLGGIKKSDINHVIIKTIKPTIIPAIKAIIDI
jgi:hypothetical protein